MARVGKEVDSHGQRLRHLVHGGTKRGGRSRSAAGGCVMHAGWERPCCSPRRPSATNAASEQSPKPAHCCHPSRAPQTTVAPGQAACADCHCLFGFFRHSPGFLSDLKTYNPENHPSGWALQTLGKGNDQEERSSSVLQIAIALRALISYLHPHVYSRLPGHQNTMTPAKQFPKPVPLPAFPSLFVFFFFFFSGSLFWFSIFYNRTRREDILIQII